MRMQVRCWWTAAFAGLVGLVVACGGSDDPVEEPPDKYPDVGSFCNARARAECSEEIQSRCASTEDSCIAKRQGLCMQDPRIMGGGQYRPKAAEECLAVIEPAYLDDTFTVAEKANIDDACRLLFRGIGGEGASCMADFNCNFDVNPDFECIKPTGAEVGSCHVPVETDPGRDCSAADAVCSEGFFCSAGNCIERKGAGSTCSSTLLCKEDLRCAMLPDATEGVCESAAGATCVTDADCGEGFCLQVAAATQCGTTIIFAPNEPICSDFRN